MIKNSKKIKTIVALALCALGILWLLPTLFVQKTVLTISDFTTVSEDEITDTFAIEFTYPRGQETKSGQYTEVYPKSWAPSVGGQEAGYYYTLPPFSVHAGDPPSPVPPLCCIALGGLVYVLKRPKFLRKQESENEQ